jgi:serine-type D-Ala-D-Ala carboxypeptidase/endopeptidase (penicillin-binding protein 4)
MNRKSYVHSSSASFFVLHFSCLIIFSSCSVSQKISARPDSILLTTPELQRAHTGFAVYDPAAGKYLYNYQGDKNFIPASNTKIFACYAGMKYLGDSLTGLRYQLTDSAVYITPTGDPTFLHPGFKNQHAFQFLQKQQARIVLNTGVMKAAHWGNGWAWNDYADDYMLERSPMPIYGNWVLFKKGNAKNISGDAVPAFDIEILPAFFKQQTIIADTGWQQAKGFSVQRSIDENRFVIVPHPRQTAAYLPFRTMPATEVLLADTLHQRVTATTAMQVATPNRLRTQPTDSMLRPMMQNSDNFFAEQTLLMASGERLGYLSDEAMIDTLLATDLKDIPQKPRWADGSGLSRYNAATPQSLVWLLNKMKDEFGMERIKGIFASGGQGTLRNYYIADSNYIFAKTGTLSGVMALSGYLYTRQNRLLIFSVLVNGYQSSATTIRRAVEVFLKKVREEN